jgi:hypothetical protein
VGSAGFFIALAGVDREKPGRYLLGIERDGATYHSARSARDQDRLRQEVLEALGWGIHRIWSTDWFRNPQQELKHAVEAIEEAKFYVGVAQEKPARAKLNTLADVARESEPARPVTPTIPAYEMVQPRGVYTGVQLHLVPAHNLADSVAQVVRVESPVHMQEVARRIAEAAFVARGSTRIRAAIDNACSSAVRTGTARRSGKFLWHPEMREVALSDRTGLPDAFKKVELVAPEEISEAIKRVTADSYGMESREVPSAVLRLLFEFRRTTEAAQRSVEKVVDKMIVKGELFHNSGQLVRNERVLE